MGGELVHRVHRGDFATAPNPPWRFEGRPRVTLGSILLRSVLAVLWRSSIACGHRKKAASRRNRQRTAAQRGPRWFENHSSVGLLNAREEEEICGGPIA